MCLPSDSDWNVGGGGVPATRPRQPVAMARPLDMGSIPSASWNDTIVARNITQFTLNAGTKLPRNFDISNASLLSYFNMMMEDGMFSVNKQMPLPLCASNKKYQCR